MLINCLDVFKEFFYYGVKSFQYFAFLFFEKKVEKVENKKVLQMIFCVVNKIIDMSSV